MTRFTKSNNGKYVVSGKSYDILIGTRAQVWHETAYKTSGGLTKSHLFKNKAGRIVSKAKHISAKKEKRLLKAGFGTKKGKFGVVKLHKRHSKRGGSYNSSHNSTQHSSHNNSSHNNSSHHANHTAKHYKGGKRRQRGGLSQLTPSYYDGKGVGTSGVFLQTAVAGTH
jgi:hypothetical protein